MATIALTSTNNNVSVNYHTVVICADLPVIDKDYHIDGIKDLPSDDYWIGKMDEKVDEAYCKVQHVTANGPYTSSYESHAIFSAFLFAYNSHEDIILSPDDIWLLICIYFSQYVNDNAEQLRTLFVDHDDRKELTIVQIGFEPNWNNFLESIRLAIGANMKNEVTQLLTSNFSTTTKIESLLSYVAIMDTFQKYFEYKLYVTRCGIRNVHFMGTLDDWNVLRQKIEKLKNFTIMSDQDKFGEYIDGLLPIIDQFIQTYQGKVDNEFWNKVMDIEHIGMGRSGKWPGTYVSGWFLKLCYGLHANRSCIIKEIKLNSFNVPVHVDNETMNESKTCYIVGGFHGVESREGRHKPVMSLAVIDDTSTIKPFKLE